jgi:hypothetical protein
MGSRTQLSGTSAAPGSIAPSRAQPCGTDNLPIDFATPNPAVQVAPPAHPWFGEENIIVAVFRSTAALLR